jgi:hypothetical protein
MLFCLELFPGDPVTLVNNIDLDGNMINGPQSAVTSFLMNNRRATGAIEVEFDSLPEGRRWMVPSLLLPNAWHSYDQNRQSVYQFPICLACPITAHSVACHGSGKPKPRRESLKITVEPRAFCTFIGLWSQANLSLVIGPISSKESACPSKSDASLRLHASPIHGSRSVECSSFGIRGFSHSTCRRPSMHCSGQCDWS